MLESKNKLGVQNNIWGVWCGAIPSRTPAWICFSFTSTPSQQSHGFINISVQLYSLCFWAPHSMKIIVICFKLQSVPLEAEQLLLFIFFFFWNLLWRFIVHLFTLFISTYSNTYKFGGPNRKIILKEVTELQ